MIARGRRVGVALLALLLVAWMSMAVWHWLKPVPVGLDLTGPAHAVGSVEFIADETWVDGDGMRQLDHRIFDVKLALIAQAERLILADFFLFNDFAGNPEGEDMRALSGELATALIQRKQARPEIEIVFITDPINTLYGGMVSDHLEAMRAAGIEVVMTDLGHLRDSNPIWSGLWRLCCRWLGNSPGGRLPNPVGDESVSLRTWLRMANFKANHRKAMVVDQGENWTGLVTSANPHDASSAHGNTALVFSGRAALDLLDSERAILSFSAPGLTLARAEVDAMTEAGDATIRLLTEAAIRDAVVQRLAEAGPGSRVDLAMFYLSHRAIVEGLLAAHQRGARVRVLLDPNEHAFGRQKNGVPNRPVAAELTQAGISVRWCRTTGEQCHSKQLLIRQPGDETVLILGSANYTRRNLDNFNPETNVELTGPGDLTALVNASAWFERRWNNHDLRQYSVDYEQYADERRWRYWQYRVMERTGLSTF
ncbi:MAG: phospholipase [Wenzhouxiangella sp.]|nr:phospholipase [Wenzhouxiangella sp.]